MADLLPRPKFSISKGDGTPAVGWKINTYEVGTSTKKATFTAADEVTENTNPVILDARGEADIWWSGSYKVVITDDADVTIITVDNYGSAASTSSSGQFNLVLNGDLEAATSDSDSVGNFTVTEYTSGTATLISSATDQQQGKYAIKFTSTGSGGGHMLSEFFAVQEGLDYNFSWAMKSSAADVRNLVELHWYTSAQASISTTTLYDDSTANPTSWTETVERATAPSTARFAKIQLYGCHSSDATAGSTWYDNIRAIERVSLKAVTNYTSCSEIYLNQNTATETFDVDAVIGGTAESIGPTGSGADNIWTDLDNVSTAAKALILNVSVGASGTTSGTQYFSTVSMGYPGASLRIVANAQLTNRSGAVETDNETNEVIILCDSNRVFDCKLNQVGGDASLDLVGWIE